MEPPPRFRYTVRMIRLRATCLVLTFAALAGCERQPPAAAPGKVGVAKDVVATVNGTPVTRFEVMLRMRLNTPQPPPMSSEGTSRALDEIITDELFAQKAKAAGLERDPAFLEEMARVEAQVAEVRRRELTKLFLHKEIIDKAQVSDAEALAYFRQHEARFAHEWVVAQIVLKGRPAIDAVVAELAQGKDFDTVAGERLPTAGPDDRPWLLPPMRWDAVPPAWWTALDALEVGQVSAPIAMVNDRWVVVKLLERRPVAAADFDQVKPFLQTQLKAERIETTRRDTEAALRRAAKVERIDQPTPAP